MLKQLCDLKRKINSQQLEAKSMNFCKFEMFFFLVLIYILDDDVPKIINNEVELVDYAENDISCSSIDEHKLFTTYYY